MRKTDPSTLRGCGLTRLAILTVTLAPGCVPPENGLSDWLDGLPIEEIFSAALGDTLARTDFPVACGPGLLGLIVPDCPLRRGCFTEACEIHNTCYGTCGLSQKACDDGLWEDLRTVCIDTFAPAGERRLQCLALALGYTEATRELGSESFQASQATCTRPAEAPNRSIVGIDGTRVYYAIEQNDAQLSLWVVDAITRELMRVGAAPGETVLRTAGDSLIVAQSTAAGVFDIAAVNIADGARQSLWDHSFHFSPANFVPAVDGDRVAWLAGDAFEVFDLVRREVSTSIRGEFEQGFVESFVNEMAVIVRCVSNCDSAWLLNVADGSSIELPFDVRIGDQTFDLGIYDGAKANRNWLLARAFSDREQGPTINILGYHIATGSWHLLADFPGSSAGIVELTDTDALIVEHSAELFPVALTLRIEHLDLNTGQRNLIADLSDDPAVWGIGPAFDSVGIPAVFVTNDRVQWIDERSQRLVVYDLAERTNWTVRLEGYELDE